MDLGALPFREVWAVDFEFIAQAGDRPDPVCLAACDLRTGRKIKLWRDQFGAAPPYRVDADTLFVAYFASAELGCHRALGWPMPIKKPIPYPKGGDENFSIRSIRNS